MSSDDSHIPYEIIKPKQSGLNLTNDELMLIGNILGSAYYNIFTNILGSFPHPLVELAKAQLKDGMTKLGLEDFIVD